MTEDRNIFQLSTEFSVRIVGALVVMTVAILFAVQIPGTREQIITYATLLGTLGFLTGLILTPFFTTRPLRRIRNRLIAMPAERLTAVIFGVLLGLFAGGLFSVPLSFLPDPFRQIFPLASVFVFSYLGAVIFMLRQNDLKSLFSSFQQLTGRSASSMNTADGMAGGTDGSLRTILLDTSVIIDGRITDISKTGFLRGSMTIPGFILRELQHIADSSDPLRRNRGRRGLEVLRILQEEAPIPVHITDVDAPDVRDADSKLVAVAKEMRSPIMTNDYNLNRVAELQGVMVLNINDLANAVKVAYLPGEDLEVKIIQEGREDGQGVGYLEDGTMVVVEDGVYQLQKTVEVMVTKVLQTSAGRMVFARFPTKNEMHSRHPNGDGNNG